MTPKVSIVVPVYNVEKYLKRCVQSLLSQTLKEIEVILVDDGSPDKCPEICEEYVQKDSRVRVIHKKNAGLGMACNSGLEVAIGEYVAFCDSDDWVDNTMYEALYNAAKENNAQMVFSGIRTVDERGTGKLMSVADRYKVYNESEKIEELALDMIASPPQTKQERRIPMSAKIVLYERKMLIENNIRFESERRMISEDLLFNLDCLSKSKVVVEIPKVFYNYYVNSASLTGVVRKDRCEKYLILYNEILSRYDIKNPRFKTRVNRMLIGYVRDEIVRISLNKKLSIKEKREVILKIAKFPIWREIYDTYPVNQMPMHHRLYFVALRFNLISLLIIGSFLR